MSDVEVIEGRIEFRERTRVTTEVVGGLRGPKGDKGDQGEKGDKGDQGDPGPVGPTITFIDGGTATSIYE